MSDRSTVDQRGSRQVGGDAGDRHRSAKCGGPSRIYSQRKRTIHRLGQGDRAVAGVGEKSIGLQSDSIVVRLASGSCDVSTWLITVAPAAFVVTLVSAVFPPTALLNVVVPEDLAVRLNGPSIVLEKRIDGRHVSCSADIRPERDGLWHRSASRCW